MFESWRTINICNSRFVLVCIPVQLKLGDNDGTKNRLYRLSHEKNKVLVFQRSQEEKFLPGYYELPGGKVDLGEDPVEALAREFKEEVDLNVAIVKPYHTFSYIFENGN